MLFILLLRQESMTGKQHLSFGIITGIAFSAYLHKLNICQNNADMVFVVCGSVLGSLLPDIDSTESIISNILPPFTTLTSKIINNVFGHRGLLHYSLFWIVMAFFTANYNHFTQGLFFAVFGIYFLMPALTKVYLHCHGSSIEINHSMCFPKSGGCM